MHNDWEGFATRSQAAIDGLAATKRKENEEQDYSGSERQVESKQRIGQDIFRASVLSAYEFRCCITGLAVPELLIASHIIPWSKDTKHRLNPRNGLSLSALHDKAFDIGLLGIDSDYRVAVSPALRKTNDPFLEQSLWKYHGQKIMLPEKFSPDPEFLRIHFETIFIQ